MKRMITSLLVIVLTILSTVEAGIRICDLEFRSTSLTENTSGKNDEASFIASVNSFGIGTKTENTGLDNSPAPLKILNRTTGTAACFNKSHENRIHAEILNYLSGREKLSLQLSSPNKVYPFHSFW